MCPFIAQKGLSYFLYDCIFSLFEKKDNVEQTSTTGTAIFTKY